MDLLTYISHSERKAALAAAVGTDPGYLWQIATRWRGKRASASMAERIEAATAELGPATVTKESVIWGLPAMSSHEQN